MCSSDLDDNVSNGKADVVIADVPCSGLGIIGRKPDIKYNSNIDKIKELVQLQRKILGVVQNYVKPQGYLIYSTCTINSAENEENVKWLCENYPFEVCDIDNILSDKVTNMHKDNIYGTQLLPGINNTDGFFICRLRRK